MELKRSFCGDAHGERSRHRKSEMLLLSMLSFSSLVWHCFALVFLSGLFTHTVGQISLTDAFPSIVNVSHPACGQDITIRDRIISGTYAKANQYPFYAVFLNYKKPFAGGTIVNEYWVLTAAHIVTSGLWKSRSPGIKIGVGSHLIDKMQLYDVELSIPHPGYKRDRQYDIALVKLTKPIRFTSTIYPVCFPPLVLSKVPSKKINVAGFGYEKYKSAHGTKAMKTVMLDVMNHDKCRRIYKRINHPIESLHTCTWTEGKDACLGDSGGPMFIKQNGRFVQWGVVSHGVTCADEFPGVFATITHFLYWLKRVLNSDL